MVEKVLEELNDLFERVKKCSFEEMLEDSFKLKGPFTFDYDPDLGESNVLVETRDGEEYVAFPLVDEKSEHILLWLSKLKDPCAPKLKSF